MLDKHLELAEDTTYKRAILDLCNEMAVESDIEQLGIDLVNPEFEF